MHTMGKCWQCIGFLAGLVCFVVLGMARSEHLPHLAWMAHYRSASGTDCCSERDCVLAVVAVWTAPLEGDAMVVRVNDTMFRVPTKSIHRSEDGQTYWCCKTGSEAQCPPLPTAENTRCVFFAEGV